jgi:phage terminase large subunit
MGIKPDKSLAKKCIRSFKEFCKKFGYAPFDRQKEFHDSAAKYRLFGGAAGPGKTKALLYEAIYQAHLHPGVDTLLLRRTYPELEASLITYFRRDVPRELYEKYNEAKHTVTWLNGSTTRFAYCDNETDVYRYQGAEYLFIGIDELTHFTLKQWQFLTSRNRCYAKKSRPCMAGATNPGNIGHAWVKALWVDRVSAPGMDRADQYDQRDYDFIRATIADNEQYSKDENYLKTLGQLPEALRRAFLDGEWDVYAGQYFDIFSPERHTVRAEQVQLEPWTPRWISIDWGFEHPSAVYWHATRNDGVFVTYREFVQNRLSPRMLAAAIAERSVDRLGRAERIRDVFLSPDAFAQRTADASIAEQLGDGLAAAGLPRPTPADNDRVGGWMLMYQALEADRWLIAENCVRLIENLPTLTRDPANVEDTLKCDGDDPADSARYGLKSALEPGRAPAEVLAAERITATDPTSRAIWLKKFSAEESRRVAPVVPRRWRPQGW